MNSVRVEHPDLLAEPETLERRLCPIVHIGREPLSAPGLSGARFERLSLR